MIKKISNLLEKMKGLFMLPDDIVREVITGKIDYNSLPCDDNNEVDKGYIFEDQARTIINLEKDHSAKCSALEKECIKESCSLYHRGKHGALDGESAVCREYKLNFPDAQFDSQMNFALLGIDKIDLDKSLKNLDILKKRGGNYICLNCARVYGQKPTKPYEDGHGGRRIEMCACGSDMFDTINSYMDSLKSHSSLK